MWEKYSVRTTQGEGVEIVTAALLGQGITGMEIIDKDEMARDLKALAKNWDYADESLAAGAGPGGEACVVFYLPKEDAGLLEKICRALGEQGHAVEPSGFLDEADWLNEWKKHFKPLKIGKIVIVPEWEEYVPAGHETVVRLNPGGAFGTGQHESTELCVRALQAAVKPGDRVLDIGCGSGILSCVAAALGAERVLACDIDPAGAVSAARENAALNGFGNIDVLAGDALAELRGLLSGAGFDAAVANIVADVAIGLAPLVGAMMKPGGLFIASGIIDERASDVRGAFSAAGLRVLREERLNGWLAYTAAQG